MSLDLIKKLQQDPYQAQYIPLDELRDIIEYADRIYYLSDQPPIFDDQTYDIIREIYEQRSHQAGPHYPEITSPEIAMPVKLGSIRKVKYTRMSTKTVDQQIQDWLKTIRRLSPCPVVKVLLSDKLDGASGLYYQKSCRKRYLFTREGRNITHLLQYIKLPILPARTAVRGELILTKKDFQQYYSRKFANARNLVSGQLNSKPESIDVQLARRIHFVAYELIDLDMDIQLRPSCQMINLEKLGLRTPHYQLISTKMLTEQWLSDYLEQRRQQSPYEIDGIVITAEIPIDRQLVDPQGYPKYAIAYKQDITGVPVTITRIEWAPTKTGKLAPVAIFPEVTIQGSKVSRATAYHGQFVVQHKLGPGARVIINKGGDIIPQIVEVLSPATSGLPQLPSVSHEFRNQGPFLYATENTAQHQQQQLLFFLKSIGAKHIGPSLVNKLYQAGITSVIDLMNLSADHFRNLPGVKEKTTKRALEQIETSLATASLAQIIAGSGVLGEGVGVHRLQLIIDHFKGLPRDVTPEELQSIRGIGPKMARQIASRWHLLAPLLEVPIVKQKLSAITARPAQLAPSAPKVLFTGFRDAQLKKLAEQAGYRVVSSFSKSLDLLVVKDRTTSNTKIDRARQLGIPIITKEEFLARLKS